MNVFCLFYFLLLVFVFIAIPPHTGFIKACLALKLMIDALSLF
ncbi:hypothetical protein HMPREF1433_00971 [Helicobacter pylori GAMchJs117Ai]|nr:hypothetical protein HMPREF1405_00919 [Helicobacter pylori GAM231Ai]EMH03369.1 hypothetical protein HMPREF1407_01263 [Helicobacter pylori GAM244Ai]EMJ39998.1 hypothetical protein HMPREF1433_00971 [Helicobacter pylori GAMchJs117Ai]EMJ43790.1 hypothetical protein HMPREF1434_00879 [Helicobacter pylori GAMchJs124i]